MPPRRQTEIQFHLQNECALLSLPPNTCLYTRSLNVLHSLQGGNRIQRKQEASYCFISVASFWLSHLCCGSGPHSPTAISIDSVCSVAPCLSYCPSEAIIKTGRLWCVLWLFTKRLQPRWIIKNSCTMRSSGRHCALFAGPADQSENISKTECNINPVPVCSAFISRVIRASSALCLNSKAACLSWDKEGGKMQLLKDVNLLTKRKKCFNIWSRSWDVTFNSAHWNCCQTPTYYSLSKSSVSVSAVFAGDQVAEKEPSFLSPATVKMLRRCILCVRSERDSGLQMCFPAASTSKSKALAAEISS